MLYSVIPPILLVLSVIGIIIFFVKKAPEAERLSEESGKDSRIGSSAMISKDRVGNVKMSAGKQIGLAILEWIVGMLRKFFFISEKSFGKMIGNIKEKRNSRSERKIHESKKRENYLIEKLNSYDPETEAPAEQQRKKPEARESRVPYDEKPVRPMLSDRVVVPNMEERKKKEEQIRERLENILIERIAMNPRDTEAYERLGEYYFDLENYDHAKECFKQVIKLDPTNRSVKYKMKKLETLLSR